MHDNSNSKQIMVVEENIISNETNGLQDTTPIEIDVNDTQNNSTNLTKPTLPNISIDSPNVPIKRTPPSSCSSSSPPVMAQPFEQQIYVNFVQPKTIKEKLLDSSKTNKKSQDSSKTLKKSSSLENVHTKINEGLKLAEGIFSHDTILFPIRNIIENFTKKSINIYSLCDEVNVDILTHDKIIDKVITMINDRAIKAKLTKLPNLLFQSIPKQ